MLLLVGAASAVLLIVGFLVGAVGSRMFGLGDPFLKQPAIHLEIQPVFPKAARDAALGYGHAAEKTDDHGESAADSHASDSSDSHASDSGHSDSAWR